MSAVQPIMLQRLQTMGAKILSQSDDAIRFVTKKGDDITMQWGKRNVYGDMENIVTSWKKTNKKTGEIASMNRRFNYRPDDSSCDLDIITTTKHVNKRKRKDFETEAVHRFWSEEDPNSLKSFKFDVNDYWSEIAHSASGKSFVTRNGEGRESKLAYTVAKGKDDGLIVDSIKQGVQKINFLY